MTDPEIAATAKRLAEEEATGFFEDGLSADLIDYTKAEAYVEGHKHGGEAAYLKTLPLMIGLRYGHTPNCNGWTIGGSCDCDYSKAVSFVDAILSKLNDLTTPK